MTTADCPDTRQTHPNVLPLGHICTDLPLCRPSRSFLLCLSDNLLQRSAQARTSCSVVTVTTKSLSRCLPRGPTSRPAPSSVPTSNPQVRLGLGLLSLVNGLFVCLFVILLFITFSAPDQCGIFVVFLVTSYKQQHTCVTTSQTTAHVCNNITNNNTRV